MSVTRHSLKRIANGIVAAELETAPEIGEQRLDHLKRALDQILDDPRFRPLKGNGLDDLIVELWTENTHAAERVADRLADRRRDQLDLIKESLIEIGKRFFEASNEMGSRPTDATQGELRALLALTNDMVAYLEAAAVDAKTVDLLMHELETDAENCVFLRVDPDNVNPEGNFDAQ